MAMHQAPFLLSLPKSAVCRRRKRPPSSDVISGLSLNAFRLIFTSLFRRAHGEPPTRCTPAACHHPEPEHGQLASIHTIPRRGNSATDLARFCSTPVGMDPALDQSQTQNASASGDFLPAYNAPSVPLAPPPDYETAVGANPPTPASQHGITNHKPLTLSIEGKYVYSSLSKPDPIYSLTHELDGHELSLQGILLTRLDQNPVRRMRTTVKRDVFALRAPPALHIGPTKYEIDGLRYLSGKNGYMTKKVSRTGMGWTVGGRGLPSFVLRPSTSADSDAELYEWRDRTNDHYIATETRRRWDKQNKVEISPPTLELRIGANVDKGYLDFLVAAWCMHNWREAKDITKEPLSWEECKRPFAIHLPSN
ncbi:predicted protein [Uncinocarpus reesii 1704]|uniref:Uncharacterized protein n=1 Tax=Uncinocarpus reesii (strain UAMH 1704) TaxID=336963 RepID=C4JGX8_UNCRE|nr:uncharacterized protein UREG_01229 [Uncinocarpus reesii 1704]EEP76380.1 predicted protein [Uncinocarpus reesii 1704]